MRRITAHPPTAAGVVNLQLVPTHPDRLVPDRVEVVVLELPDVLRQEFGAEHRPKDTANQSTANQSARPDSEITADIR